MESCLWLGFPWGWGKWRKRNTAVIGQQTSWFWPKDNVLETISWRVFKAEANETNGDLSTQCGILDSPKTSWIRIQYIYYHSFFFLFLSMPIDKMKKWKDDINLLWNFMLPSLLIHGPKVCFLPKKNSMLTWFVTLVWQLHLNSATWIPLC